MKWFSTIMLATAATLIFTSCKKNDDSEKASIIGTWRLKKGVEYTLVDGKLQGEKKQEDLTKENYSMIFGSDGKLTTTQGVTYTDETGETQGLHTEDGTYSYANDRVTVNYDGLTETAKVTLGANSLLLMYEYNESENGHSITEVYEEYYTRQ